MAFRLDSNNLRSKEKSRKYLDSIVALEDVIVLFQVQFPEPLTCVQMGTGDVRQREFRLVRDAYTEREKKPSNFRQ